MKRTFLITNLILASMLYSAAHSNSNPVLQNTKLRIISLAPSTTEILFALGLEDEIVGVTQFCDYPQKALSKEKIGTFSQPNIEKIISLKPDIIFCTGLEQASTITKLRQLNLSVCVSDPTNLKELFDSISEIGNLTNKKNEASALIKEMKTAIEEINSKVKIIPVESRLKVFVEIWHNPIMTAGKDSFVDELITLAGGINIAHDTKRPYSYFSSEQVIKRNPDCIILSYMSMDSPLKIIRERFGWNNLSAVKNQRIYNDIDPNTFLRPGPRLIDGLNKIHKKLYP